ncbi:MAG: hypothetical protein M1818_000895 [Claussenomyces sp. TS43310]|nr:MAG: hypothetical protein M1818_000895 [Claussenomyces sp. TS43310]
MSSTIRQTISAIAASVTGRKQQSYETLAQDGDGARPLVPTQTGDRRITTRPVTLVLLAVLGLGMMVAGIFYFQLSSHLCDGVASGFQCQSNISHFWGQYSPYYTVPSNISADVPQSCTITFVQILSRHGARDPTARRTIQYHDTIEHIQKTVDAKNYKGKYKFLGKYQYNLGADELSVFGQQQMVNSGIKFYERYQSLAKDVVPFIRSAGQRRVVESAQNFTQGFHSARAVDRDGSSSDSYPYGIVVIPEGPVFNNTLDHSLCEDFETGPSSKFSDAAKSIWANFFTPPIAERVNSALKGADLDADGILNLMDMCPFDTVHDPAGAISPFCALFTADEWHAYDYYQSLNFYYGFGWGNPLGPTQGVGFTNELIARMTQTPVNDHTSTNSTLDNSSTTFPLGDEVKLYADFSHDNDLTGIFAALGLYNATQPLSNTTLQTIEETRGYSASWSVPFASRAYFEKMACAGQDEELVRVVVNDRVLPLQTCQGDELGRCRLSAFVDSLSFARSGGHWDMCFV